MASAKRTSKKKPQKWDPVIGEFADYCGKTSNTLRGGGMVRVVSEASKLFTVVEAVDRTGASVKLRVKTSNLARPQPGLFDD